MLAQSLPEEVRELLSFPLGPRAVHELADRVVGRLEAPASVLGPTRDALVATVRRNWSWEGVARGVLDAAGGR